MILDILKFVGILALGWVIVTFAIVLVLAAMETVSHRRNRRLHGHDLVEIRRTDDHFQAECECGLVLFGERLHQVWELHEKHRKVVRTMQHLAYRKDEEEK